MSENVLATGQVATAHLQYLNSDNDRCLRALCLAPCAIDKLFSRFRPVASRRHAAAGLAEQYRGHRGTFFRDLDCHHVILHTTGTLINLGVKLSVCEEQITFYEVFTQFSRCRAALTVLYIFLICFPLGAGGI